MILKTIIVFVCVFISFVGVAQQNGINFESGTSWSEILAKAKAQHKLIFMDCYATWCGPCKFMDQKIFTDSLAGNYFNAHFISVKMQMDKTHNDSQDIRDWYAIADSISQKYAIKAYPTYLFFTPDGGALSQLVGESENAVQFIDRVAVTQGIDNQYFTILATQAEHKSDSAFLFHATFAAQNAGDERNTILFVNRYIACLKEPLTKYNINLIQPYIASESDEGFAMFVQNARKIDQISGQTDLAEQTLADVIFKKELASMLINKDTILHVKAICDNVVGRYSSLNRELLLASLEKCFKNVIGRYIDGAIKNGKMHAGDWTEISNELDRRFPRLDCKQLLLTKETRYYYENKVWGDCAKKAIYLIDHYSGEMGDVSINNITWDCIFLHTMDKSILNRALSHILKLVQKTPASIDYLDTYANLLYKTGHSQKAIIWETKADSIAQKYGGDGGIKATLEKMRNGEPTWLQTSAGS